MSRLIDADLFWEDLCENAEKGLMQSDSIEEVLNRQPTIEVVHCKECRHYMSDFCTRYGMTTFDGSPIWLGLNPDGFCSRGERRTE